MRTHPTIAEFLATGNSEEPSCWVYPSSRDKDGYAEYHEDGWHSRAHRAAYEFVHGPVPEGRMVLHTCDNRPCARPSHLFLGDAIANAADAVSKDRHSRGERNGCSKLTADQVIAIRADNRRQVDIAADYDIRQTTVSEIKRGNRWGHLHAD